MRVAVVGSGPAGVAAATALLEAGHSVDMLDVGHLPEPAAEYLAAEIRARVDDLVDDPWRVLPCPADGTGCVVEFADPEFADSARDAVYYVRAIEAPDLLIHGENPLQCRYDELGRCVEITPCGGSWPGEDDCLGEAEPRAWSSPIFVNHAGS